MSLVIFFQRISLSSCFSFLLLSLSSNAYAQNYQIMINGNVVGDAEFNYICTGDYCHHAITSSVSHKFITLLDVEVLTDVSYDKKGNLLRASSHQIVNGQPK